MISLYLLSFDWILKVTTEFTTSLARQTLIHTMQQEVSDYNYVLYVVGVQGILQSSRQIN